MEIKRIKDDIRGRLKRIANKEITDDDSNLLGSPYYLEPRELAYLFMDIQEAYHIRIEGEELRNQQFATINGIALIIDGYIENRIS